MIKKITNKIREARKTVNEGGRKLFNYVHKGWGDYLADTEIDLKVPAVCALGLGFVAGEVGCSTTPKPVDPALHAMEQANKKDDQSYDLWLKNLKAKTHIYSEQIRLEKEKRKANRYFDAKKASLERSIVDESFSQFDFDIDGYEPDDARKAAEDQAGMFFHILPYSEFRNPKSLVDDCNIDLDSLDTPLNVTGVQFGFGKGKGFGYLNFGTWGDTVLKGTSTGESYSKATTSGQSLALGAQYNFLQTDNFNMGLHLHLLQNREEIDGFTMDSILGRRDFNETSDSRGWGAGIELEWMPVRWFGLNFRKGMNQYFESDGVKTENTDTYALKFKIY
jgi:hypothetical protein